MKSKAINFLKQRKEFYTADGKFEATGEFGERFISEMMEEYASQSAPGSKDVEQWYHNWMAAHDKAEIATVNVLDMLKDFASQQPPPVSAMEDETEKIFKPYCIDFFSKESEEERKIKIDFAFNKKDEAFAIFQNMYHDDYGSINIDENLVSIHTGGWSENEYLISIFKNTEWWRQNFRMQITGGHYYFDTDRINGMKEWDITKRISATPTK